MTLFFTFLVAKLLLELKKTHWKSPYHLSGLISKHELRWQKYGLQKSATFIMELVRVFLLFVWKSSDIFLISWKMAIIMVFRWLLLWYGLISDLWRWQLKSSLESKKKCCSNLYFLNGHNDGSTSKRMIPPRERGSDDPATVLFLAQSCRREEALPALYWNLWFAKVRCVIPMTIISETILHWKKQN